MCTECDCENKVKCSVKGYQPIGWCCEYCKGYSLGVINYCNSKELVKVEIHLGDCIGCERKNVQLVWTYSNLTKGFCQTCLRTYEKRELLDIIIKKSEELLNIP